MTFLATGVLSESYLLTLLKIVKKEAAQENALIELYRKHYTNEKDLKKEHAEILYELQMELMVAVHEKQLTKLDGQHKK
jgi:hypothetical protein